MRKRVNVAPIRTFDVCDWDQVVTEDRIVFTPSATNFFRQLWVTLLAAVVIGGMWWMWGLPPGSAAIAAKQRAADRLAQQIEQAERQSRRLSTSAGPTGARMSEQYASQADRLRNELADLRAEFDTARPTLGTAYDNIYWGVFTVAIILGLGLPALCLIVRAELRVEGDRIVFSRRLGRTWRFPIGSFVGVKPTAQRLATRGGTDTPAADHGWLWELNLVADADRPRPPGDPKPRSVVFRVELSPTLPARDSILPKGVANIARLLEQYAGLPCSPASSTDVQNETSIGWRGVHTKKLKTRDAEDVDLYGKPPLE